MPKSLAGNLGLDEYLQLEDEFSAFGIGWWFSKTLGHFKGVGWII